MSSSSALPDRQFFPNSTSLRFCACNWAVSHRMPSSLYYSFIAARDVSHPYGNERRECRPCARMHYAWNGRHPFSSSSFFAACGEYYRIIEVPDVNIAAGCLSGRGKLNFFHITGALFSRYNPYNFANIQRRCVTHHIQYNRNVPIMLIIYYIRLIYIVDLLIWRLSGSLGLTQGVTDL